MNPDSETQFDLATVAPRLAQAHRQREREFAAMRRFGTSNPSLPMPANEEKTMGETR